MKCYPMIVVKDVAASSTWYQKLLGLRSGHGGDEFEMLMDGDELALALHHLDVTQHTAISDPRESGPGGGVLLYFSVQDVAPYFQLAKELGADIVDEPHLNPVAHSVEFSLRDPDGYAMTISHWAGGA